MVWDEANQVQVFIEPSPQPPPLDFPESIMNWHIPIIKYIKETDPYKHLVTSGNAGTSFFIGHPVINLFDYYQGHRYKKVDNNQEMDKLLFDEIQTMFQKTSMPVLIEEFGIQPYKDYMRQKDPHSYNFHSIFWSSLFSGSFGIPMYWELKNLWNDIPDSFDRYKGVGKFIKESLPELQENLNPKWEDNNSGFRVVYLSNNNASKIYGWMQDKEFAFNNVLNHYSSYLINFDNPSPPRNNYNVPIELNVKHEGDYIINWYSTISGEFFKEEIANVQSNLKLSFALPEELYNGTFADGTFIIRYDCENKWNNAVLNENSPKNVRSNANIIANSYGEPLFVGTDNTVRMMWFNGEEYINIPLREELSKKVRNNSFLTIDNKNRVYYIAEDNKVHRLFYNYSTKLWEEETIANSETYSVRENSNISVSKVYNIFFISSRDNKAHVLWLDNGNYKNNTILPKADKVGMTSLLSFDYNYYTSLYYIGMNDKKMHKLYWDNNDDQWYEIIIDNNHLTDIRDFSPIRVRHTNNRIYYFGADNKIHEKRLLSGQYVDAIIASYNNYIVQLNSGLEFDSKNELYFTSDNRIHKTYWDNNLGKWVIEEIGNNFPQDVNEYLCINKFDHIFYKGDDLRIHVDYYGCNDDYKNVSNKNKDEIYNSSVSTKDLKNQSYNVNTKNVEEVVSLYPNPANKYINIDLINFNGKAVITFSNLQGIQKARYELYNNKTTINIDYIPSGVYIICIENNGVRIFKKVVINK